MRSEAAARGGRDEDHDQKPYMKPSSGRTKFWAMRWGRTSTGPEGQDCEGMRI